MQDKNQDWQAFYELKLWPIILFLAAFYCAHLSYVYFSKTSVYVRHKPKVVDFGKKAESKFYVYVERDRDGLTEKIYRSEE